MMTEADYIAYFENLARQLKAIQHTDEQKRFYVVKDDNMTEVETAVRSSLALPALLLDQYRDDVSIANDNFKARVYGGFSVIFKFEQADPISIRQARQQARTLALKIIARMRRDSVLPNGALQAYKLMLDGDFDGNATQVVAGIATGWGFGFEWLVPQSMAVNSADWLDLN